MTAGDTAASAYRLQVAGRLDARWSDWFDGFSVTSEADGTTTLSGSVADQAQLHRLLGKIRDLGVTLVAVQACGHGKGEQLCGHSGVDPDSAGPAAGTRGSADRRHGSS